MAGQLRVERLSGALDLDAAAVGGIRVKVDACEVRITKASLNSAIKASLRSRKGLTAALDRIDSGSLVVKGRYNVVGFAAEIHLTPGRSGRVHVDLVTFSALRLPVGEISSLRDRVADQIRQSIPRREGLLPGTGSRLATIDVRALARHRGIELPQMTALLLDEDAVVIRFGEPPRG